MTTTTSSTLADLTRLSWHRPAAEASTEVVAAWYEEKYAVHTHLAAQCVGEDRERELAYALAAFSHAHRLRRHTGGREVVS